MIWKTDWEAADNYAANGASDLARLNSNYQALAQRYRDVFGATIAVVSLGTLSYASIPFAEMLNTIEENCEELRVWHFLPWVGARKTWTYGQRAPDYADINRWETNGQTVEITQTRSMTYMVYCGVGVCGRSWQRQNNFRRQ